VFNIKTNI